MVEMSKAPGINPSLSYSVADRLCAVQDNLMNCRLRIFVLGIKAHHVVKK